MFKTKQSHLLNAYWQWVYFEFCSVSIPAGFHVSFKKMKTKIKKLGIRIYDFFWIVRELRKLIDVLEFF